MRRWSGPRLGAAAVLGSWATLFWTLLLTGRTALYLSSRTAWLVPMGAVLLSVAAVSRLATARTVRTEHLDARGWWGYATVALPVVVVLILPPITLGSFAASRRSSFSGASGLVTPDDIDHGPLTMIHVGAAQSNPEDLARLRRRAGEEVTFAGIATRGPEMPPDEVLLTRFVITCCVADATTAQVRVIDVPPGSFEEGDWLEVTGRIYPLGDEILVAASATQPIPPPESPYLSAI
jgi:uncharacterized repeat protein (TIGR03943 family)